MISFSNLCLCGSCVFSRKCKVKNCEQKVLAQGRWCNIEPEERKGESSTLATFGVL